MKRNNKNPLKREYIPVFWWCRTCWTKGKSEYPKEEINGFTLEGIRIKIQNEHQQYHQSCTNPDVRLGH